MAELLFRFVLFSREPRASADVTGKATSALARGSRL